MCLYPRLVKNPKFKPNKKNGGQVPPVLDERTVHVPLKCNKCMECRKQYGRDWQIRLIEDISVNTKARFITLTFSNEAIRHLHEQIPQQRIRTRHVEGKKVDKEVQIEGYDRDNAIAIKAVHLFLERWRKKYKRSLRHWLITELGHEGTENIHLHGIVWQPDYFKGTWLEFTKEVENIWNSGKVPYGFTWRYKWVKGKQVNYVSEQTINYCIKYVTKIDADHKAYVAKILCSPGIGANYTETKMAKTEQWLHRNSKGQWQLKTYTKYTRIKRKSGNWLNNKFNGKDTNEAYRTRTGHKIALPIYWRNKIYSEEEREKLWLIKLDKQERWVDGAKIDVSKDDKEYYEALETARKKNNQLGYGNDKKNWSRAKYEHEKRRIMLLTRLGADYPKEWDLFNIN